MTKSLIKTDGFQQVTRLPDREIQPLISVCMIAYNMEAYISEAITSVLQQQTTFPFELVIGEDCSTDSTLAICETFEHSHPDQVRVLRSPQNRGLSLNAFRTIRACKGKYIAMCDSDDYWSDPHKLQKQVEFLESNPEYGLIYTDVEVVDQGGNEIEDNAVAQMRHGYEAGSVFFKLLRGNFIPNCTVVFRSELLVLPPFWERRWYAYDHWIWLNVSMQAKVHFLPEKTASYRKHEGSVTRSTNYRNPRRHFYVLYFTLVNFHRHYKGKLSRQERQFIFRKWLSLLRRREGTILLKCTVLKHLPCYFPGIRDTMDLLASKRKKEG